MYGASFICYSKYEYFFPANIRLLIRNYCRKNSITHFGSNKPDKLKLTPAGRHKKIQVTETYVYWKL